MTYRQRLKDRRWHQFRARLIAANSGRCEDCAAESYAYLTVHHCCYLTGHKPWEYPDDLVMVLCPKCHKRRQAAEDQAHASVARLLRGEPLDLVEKVGWNLAKAAIREERRR
jgi:5-methylcytosine-specific restriction endonuclease McrA